RTCQERRGNQSRIPRAGDAVARRVRRDSQLSCDPSEWTAIGEFAMNPLQQLAKYYLLSDNLQPDAEKRTAPTSHACHGERLCDLTHYCSAVYVEVVVVWCWISMLQQLSR